MTTTEVAPASAPASTAPRLHPQTVRWLAGAGAAMALYAGLRIINVLVLIFYARRDEKTPAWRDLLLAWDAKWYAGIAEHGYDTVISFTDKGVPEMSNLAFFPLYPGLSAAVAFVLPVSVGTALLLVSWATGLAAAATLYALGSYLRDRMTGILLAGLWSVVPHGIVLSMGYSEPLFTALAAGSLLAALRKNWLTAGVLCLLAGLTRPTGAAVIAAVVLTALVAVVRNPREWRAWVAGLIAPLGLVGYMAWVGIRLGRADGYFYVQNETWKMGFDGGGYTLSTFSNMLLDNRISLELTEVSLVLLLALGLFVVALGERLPWPLLVYAGVVVFIAVTGDWFYWAKARMLIPAFPLLLPVVYAMRRSHNRVVPYVVVGGLALFSTFFSVYLTLTWHRSF
ncbi:hypothetical protein FB565_001230 [Actinoplanes lutulentus]|uniref:Dolichyl-phosphate-mannose-protein mannosyltransferase n=1 Tax=Actinoplanes lutulentus TaxID=1287878 RepID=A0A327ZE52_9ACTN|nr:hypothetical protein [Actinoplanes lutulentus]MBB2941526.1 hypothetical protein [Actinoplanes lutulentus]RAK37016.1 hypothetical protein B0I29_107278 [Actinoplanes lutulentus]